MNLEPGYRIGAYKVVRPLGQGGMGAVYEVEHERLGTHLPYFVMDLVLAADGWSRSLADIELDGLDEDRIFGWFRDLAVALDYVHAQGVVHRDVKLENVLIGEDGQAVLSDFGISRFFALYTPVMRRFIEMNDRVHDPDDVIQDVYVKIVVTFSEAMQYGWSVCCPDDGTLADYPQPGDISYSFTTKAQ